MGCPSHESTIAQVAKDASCRPLRISSAFIVNSEIGAVLSVMRRNVRWGVQYMDDEDQLDHSLIKSFKEIRSKIFLWQNQWHVFDPVVYLQPFLDVIQSDEAGAPITGVALSSIYKFLTLEVLDLNIVNVADALRQIVDAVMSCRFEVTDPASEEVVLVKILQVLLACLKNKASVMLSNQHVCDVVNTCFQIVHQASSKSELLQRIARQTMHELVRCIFSHLHDVGHTEEHLTQVGSKQHGNGHTGSTTEVGQMGQTIGEVGQTGQNNDLLMTEAYGIPCMVEIFQFLCSLLNATNVGAGPRSSSLSYDEDVPLFSLGLINSAIELGGACFDQHPQLLSLVENDLFRNLMQYGLSANPLILSTVCGIILNLYHFLRVKLKLQLEAFFSSVLMRIAQNKHGAKYQQQEVAMETIVDLCRQPVFIYEMYANYDCDVSCSNMFEDLVNVLSKSAFPVNSPLSAIHVLALEGLVAMINGMSERIGGEVALDYAMSDCEDYEPFWKVKCENYENPDNWVPYIRKMKRLKKKLMIGADRFNTDRKKGLQTLQGMRILPDPLDPVSVACFLQYTIGLDKNLVGDYLGNHEPFCVDVLREFAKTFDFREMNLDTALRVFLETFRLPGEAQKIHRVVEAFSERYYQQSPDILANKDAALLLSYSLILLNTDQHNLQVKRKMTEDDFIRNNRRINGGDDLPREYLSELYHSICENEIRMTPVQGSDFPPVVHDNWAGLIHRSRQTIPYIVCNSYEQINNEMFAILSGPTVAALSVVLDHIEQEDVLQTCVNGFLNVAKIAACYRLEDVIDGLLVSLSKFTALLVPMSVDESILAFGNDTKARKSTIAVFTIANTYGDYIRSGWRNTVDCVLRLHKLGLLPTRLAIDAVDDVEQVSESDPEKSVLLTPPAPIVLTSSHSRKLSGLMGRFSEFLYYDTEKPAPQPSREQVEAHKRAAETVKSCRVNTIFTESTFLQSESLSNLARALILAAARSNEESAVFCLELLITVTLNNRDRIMLLWQGVYEYITNIVQSAVMPSTLVEKAVFGLIRICQRLLPYKENLTDELLKSLQLVLKLDARVADAYCEHITREIMRLVKANARQLKSHLGWRVITSLLSITARHPEASEPGFETLEFIMLDGAHLLPANFVLCVNAARQFAESRVGDVKRSIKALDLMAGSVTCLVRWSRETNEAVGEEAEAAVKLYQDISEMWLRLAQTIRKVCLDPREEIRNHAVLMMQSCLIGSHGVRLQDETWSQCFDLVIFTLVSDVLEIVQEKSLKEYRNMEGTLILSLKLLSNTFLYSLSSLSRLVSFGKVWVGVLSHMERYMMVKIRGKKSDKIHETVTELLKNSLLVMKSSGILVPSDAVGSDSFWQLTWLHVKNIAPNLRTEVFPDNETEHPVRDTSVSVSSGGS
ncbi:putative Sec7 domain, guanine nucleotide exchange factor, Sec7 domain superfamily [Helianthus annuus]|uniref:Sec7 domain, guanine nucleotide exchange factor, Sec7 domain superfamily n=1 Tax=Helianthus annuus TaxID=4232 RepID=A0A9K3NGS6_HELAN|nr:ARF guanine-nucleotide exchange factor GNOM [Helianthus annuus]KAF5799791.1 putative Sec7 domain, guanine nucleotide exchange factor, Sec7 domain superfamily [Helianthus annuus]